MALLQVVIAWATFSLSASGSGLVFASWALVVVTGVLVAVTWRSLSAARGATAAAVRTATAAVAELEVSQRPILVQVLERVTEVRRLLAATGPIPTALEIELGPEPRCWIQNDSEGNPRRFYAVVPVRNVGAGPAVFDSAWLTYGPTGPSGGRLPGRASSVIVAPNDIVDLVFHSGFGPPERGITYGESREGSYASCDITYSDLGRVYEWTSHLRMTRASRNLEGYPALLSVDGIAVGDPDRLEGT